MIDTYLAPVEDKNNTLLNDPYWAVSWHKMNKPTIANRILLGAVVAVITVPCYLKLAEYLELSMIWAMPRTIIAVAAAMVILIDRIYIMLSRKISNWMTAIEPKADIGFNL